MYRLNYKFYLVFILVIQLLGCKTRYNESLIELQLNRNWEFKHYTESTWHKASVPGNILSEICPIWESSLNQWLNDSILNSTWEYKTEFNITPEIYHRDSISICLPGLNSNADVYINDTLLVNSQNLRFPFEISCKKSLVVNKNSIRIVFNPVKSYKGKDLHYPYIDTSEFCKPEYIGDCFLKNEKLSTGFRIPGLSDEPYIIAWSKAKISDIYFYPLQVSNEEAQYNAELCILAEDTSELNLEIKVEGKPLIKINDLKLKKGKNRQSVSFTIQKPRFWVINGLGQQQLYNVSFRILSGKQELQEMTFPLGITKVRFVNNQNSLLPTNDIQLNNQNIFIKGVLVTIPSTINPSQIENYYRTLVSDLKKANVNLIRLLHSNFNKPEVLYKICNENGILVWQDFPVSHQDISTQATGNAYFGKYVLPNISHLRNMACGLIYYGLNDYCSPQCSKNKCKETKNIEDNYFLMNELPEMIRKVASKATYVTNAGEFLAESIAGNAQRCNILNCIKTTFDDDKYKSINNLNFILKRVDSAEIDYNSIVKQIEGNDLYKSLANINGLNNSIKAIGLNNLIFESELKQSFEIRKLVEDSRLTEESNNGVINIPFNDTKPMLTGAINDFQGYLKPAYYTLSDVYKSVVLICRKADNTINIQAINDEFKDLDAILLCKVIDFKGKDYFVKQIPVNIKSNSTTLLLSFAESDLLKGINPDEAVLILQLNQPGRNVAKYNYFFVDPFKVKFPKPEIKADINNVGAHFNIILKSNVYCGNVFLKTNKPSTRFSDNNLEIQPGRRYKIQVIYKGSRDELSRNLEIYSLNTITNSIQ